MDFVYMDFVCMYGFCSGKTCFPKIYFTLKCSAWKMLSLSFLFPLSILAYISLDHHISFLLPL